MSLNVVMTEGMVLGANFVANPVADVSGRYGGLFLDTNGVDQASSGYFTCKVTSKGKFTASVRWMGSRILVSSLFRTDGRTTNFIAIGSLPPFRTELALDLHSKDRITGTIYAGTRRARLHADWTGTTRGRFAGRYRVALANQRIDTNQPAILGHLGIRIDDDGNAVVGKRLHDRADP